MTPSTLRTTPRSLVVAILALLTASIGVITARTPAQAGPLDTITIADSSDTEDGVNGTSPGQITFTITLDGPTEAAGASGTWTTTDGSATSDTPDTGQTVSACDTTNDTFDFKRVTAGTWTIQPNETTDTINVDLCGDTFPEANEQFTVTIAPAGTPCTGNSDCVATGTIVNNDNAPPTLLIDDPTFVETPGTGQANEFTLTLSAAPQQSTVISFKTTNGTATTADGDYTAQGSTTTPATVTFGATETSKKVAIAVTTDTRDEDNETLHLDILNAPNVLAPDTRGTATITDDDAEPFFTVSDDGTNEGTTGTGTCTTTTGDPEQCAVFNITLSAASGKTVTVDYATENGTATAGADYVAQSNSLTFAPGGSLTQTVKVPVHGDEVNDAGETFKLKLSNPVNASCTATGAKCEGIGTIVQGATTISVSDAGVTEGSGTTTASVDIILAAPTTGVDVLYETEDGTAEGGLDYEPTTSSVTFANGDTIETVQIPVYADALDEDNETFLVRAFSDDSTVATCGDCEGTVTIADDPADSPPALSVDDPSVTEGTTGTATLTFTVSLSAQSGRSVTVDYGTENGTATGGATCDGTVDYLAKSGTLTFVAGDTSETVPVTVCGDDVAEAAETLKLKLTNPDGATLSETEGTGTITNDDGPAPTVSIDSVATGEGNSGTTPLTFTVTLSQSSGKTITVGYGSSATGADPATAGSGCTSTDIDYIAVSGSLEFAPGETSKTIPVTICGDARDEHDDTFKVSLLSPRNAVLGANSEGTGTITDDDATPTISVDDTSAPEGDKALAFRIKLSAPSGLTVGVDYATSHGTASSSDYTARAGRATFAAGETIKDIVVSVTNDNVREPNETVLFTLSNPSEAPISDGQATGTIVNDDVQGYWMTASDGGLFSYGVSQFKGSQGGKPLNQPIVGMAPTPSGDGYWQVASDGGIFAYGDATFFGSMGGKPLNLPVVGMAATPDAQGYWLVASDGGIFSYGAAANRFFGSMGGKPLNKPIVGMAPTPSGKGYWLVASDGGIFAFGDAQSRFFGSMGGKPLNKPIVGMAALPDGTGYWLVASDGGVFAFGTAKSLGSTGGVPISAPVVGMARTPSGKGYWLAGADGKIYAFGDALPLGSEGGKPLNKPIVGIAAFPG